MEQTKLLPLVVQDFCILREGNYLYVDKTEIIYSLIHNTRTVFLSRPRRFGKSLLISTKWSRNVQSVQSASLFF